MAELPKGIYRHFAGKLYELIESEAFHSESLEDVVIYRAMYSDSQWGRHRIWVRPKDMFTETVTHKGTEMPRFRYIAKTLEEALTKINKGLD